MTRWQEEHSKVVKIPCIEDKNTIVNANLHQHHKSCSLTRGLQHLYVLNSKSTSTHIYLESFSHDTVSISLSSIILQTPEVRLEFRETSS
jgi:hypothetical protein